LPVALRIKIKARTAEVSADLRHSNDDLLVTAAKEGESKAFEELVERHQRQIYFAALRMTRNREDAEDVVQRSLQKAFLHLNSFVGRSSFSTWLTRVAINEALMLIRKRRSGVREVVMDDLSRDDEAAPPLDFPDPTPDPEARYFQREWLQMLSSAMSELTPLMRGAIQLRELEERSIEETAQILGISVNAAKARVFHARRKLRDVLKQHFGSTAGSIDSATHLARSTHLQCRGLRTNRAPLI
jgi:RNA polymerase sigma-70 factor (ECF subfamily)